MSTSDPESFYRPPASSLQTAAPLQPGGYGAFDFKAAWGHAWSMAPGQYLPGMALIIVFLTLSFFSYASCIALFLILPHLTAGLVLAGVAMSRDESGISHFFRGFQRFTGVLAGGWLYLIVNTLIQGAPIWLHLAVREDESEFFSGPYFDSLLELYSPEVLGVSVLLCQLVAVYFRARLLPVFPLIAERQLGPLQAIRVAWRITADHQAALFGFMLITWLLAWAGYALACFGFVLTGPVVLLAEGAALRQLLGELPPGSATEANATPP